MKRIWIVTAVIALAMVAGACSISIGTSKPQAVYIVTTTTTQPPPPACGSPGQITCAQQNFCNALFNYDPMGGNDGGVGVVNVPIYPPPKSLIALAAAAGEPFKHDTIVMAEYATAENGISVPLDDPANNEWEAMATDCDNL